jgi:hypothetical protein
MNSGRSHGRGECPSKERDDGQVSKTQFDVQGRCLQARDAAGIFAGQGRQGTRRGADDITYLPTLEGWLYLAVVIDLCSRKVVGYLMSDHLRSELASDALLSSLNAHVEAFNADKPKGDQVDLYLADDLKKLAFWNATGSGKTLLMHVNILQYRHYLDAHGKADSLNRTILLTPNEGLSSQHLDEFRASGIQAEIFNKESRGLFAGKSVEIIEVTKLKEQMGDKTVAIDAFEGNNLVLVDEGHRGAGGDEWMGARARLSEDGFSFEYSATFGQAMKAANKPGLTQEYAKCILFDYSYKYFYADGYGKDYSILNLSEEQSDDQRQIYLTACLLAFYQQQRLLTDRKATFA